MNRKYFLSITFLLLTVFTVFGQDTISVAISADSLEKDSIMTELSADKMRKRAKANRNFH